MKKLALISMTVLATAGFAMAIPSFTLPAEITVNQGDSANVVLGGADLTGVNGMNLFMYVDAPLALSGMDVDSGAGLLFTGNSTGANIDGSLLPQIYQVSVTTSTGTVAMQGDLAKFVVSTTGAPLGDYKLSTTILSGEFAGVESDFAGTAAGQATMTVHVVPEPVSALLLLAGLPLIRRRRA